MLTETITTNGFTLTINNDEYAESPREWDNMATMICEHRNYSLGDNHDLDFSECEGWEDAERVIKAEYGFDAIMLPLYLYDHSGITMNTTGFSCGWDSGRVGTIVVSRKEVRENYNVKRISAKLVSKVLEHLKAEVETYDQYLTGDVYNYSIEDEEGNVVDSCCGFFGEEYALEEGKSMLEHYTKEKVA